MRPTRYRIVLRGRLSEHFASTFDGMALEPGPDQTVLTGDVRDQAHLYGLLDRLRDFGIELVAVEPAGPPLARPLSAPHSRPAERARATASSLLEAASLR